jgi:hypothetical protein
VRAVSDFAHDAIMQSPCRECKKPRSGDLKSPTKKTAIENRRSLKLSETAVWFDRRLQTAAP